MIGELALLSACSLNRRAVAMAWFIGARGIGRRGKSPNLAANLPLRPMPRA